MRKPESRYQNLAIFPDETKVLYQGVETSSHHLTMRDGVKIAVDLLLPKGVKSGVSLPTILTMTRYWRSFELRIPAPPNKAPIGPRAPLADYLIPRGYAMVVVDARGSGASTGQWPYPWSTEELGDYGEVVNWVVAQSWCSGRIGAVGISYEGSTAQLLAATGRKEVKAVVPQQSEFDVYTDIALPGGIFNQTFIQAWSESDLLLDNNQCSKWFPGYAKLMVKGVRPVDGDKTHDLLNQALQEHQQNEEVYTAIQAITYRDDPYGNFPVTLNDFSVFHFKTQIEASGATLFSWGSWLDAGTAEAVLRRFCTFNNPEIAVIGAWSHEMNTNASPYGRPKAPAKPKLQEQWHELAGFFEQYLKEEKLPPTQKTLYYYTLGEESWKKTSSWPLPGTLPQRWYLSENQTLTLQSPTLETGEDSYKVDFQATTGKNNRWLTELVRPVNYGNRATQDRLLLTYTTAPLQEDTEITGYPVVKLFVRSTETDGAFFAYLEEVDEQGYVRYLTEGELRAIHRQISEEAPPYTTFVPYHSFKRKDSAPIPPGQVVELHFGMLPTSVLIRRGKCLRLAIAGHDYDTFARIPESGQPVITVARNQVFASYIELPIVKG
ncbi:MAG: CocE/NonD family hydrolase [Chloroflexota bacterium]|nr:CocE/NonD family hydrolase [Chloroflexota bacterium]